MTLKGGTSQACAACKYQRRKCTPECPLAPYFPPDQPKMFQNVHKLFGVRKIQNLLEALHPSHQNEAMSAIIYQANVRDRFPVTGCVGVIQRLNNDIRKYEEELYAVHAMIHMYKQQQQDQQQNPPDVPMLTDIDPASQLQLEMAPPTKEEEPFSVHNPPTSEQQNTDNVIPVTQDYSFSGSNSPYHSAYIDTKVLLNSMWISNQGNNDKDNSDEERLAPIQSQLVASQEPVTQQEDFQKYDDMRHYFDTIDDRQSYITTSLEYDEMDATQCHEQVAENELKNAAACFSLTSVN